MDHFHEVILYIIVFILSIAHLKEIIAKMFPSLKNNHVLRKYFFDENEKEIVKETLLELGVISDNTRTQLFKGKLTSHKDKKIELIEFISKFQTKYNKIVTYGASTNSESMYYINTMEAAQLSDDLQVMGEILFSLITSKSKTHIDFIITPKTGNPLLCKKIADTHGMISILGKHSKEGSFAHIDASDYHNRLITNFEGSFTLLKTAESSNRELKGIFVDCNASGGSQILALMKSFNEIVQQNNKEFKNISPVNSAYVLFRADTDDVDIDATFKKAGFNLHRWFDLNEEIKTMIYDAKITLKCSQLDANKPKHMIEIDKIILKMTENKLIF
jgi:hypothetical protein